MKISKITEEQKTVPSSSPSSSEDGELLETENGLATLKNDKKSQPNLKMLRKCITIECPYYAAFYIAASVFGDGFRHSGVIKVEVLLETNHDISGGVVSTAVEGSG
ncbi:hypothetical protein QE152_g3642 [Popillia japonica]|uniref:Uncharacterized protein n=1 Tax=Popillia japonica TaxID=7064 RepID=A0AAW1N098_POPJA